MNLISCDRCGIVFNKDKLSFPPTHTHDQDFIEENSYWIGDRYVSKIACPVCGGDIVEDQND